MGGCRCSYRNCKSATKTSENLHFFHYPVKHNERCKQWILNAQKPTFFALSEDQLRNKVVCELHFENRCFTNSQKKRLLHDAVPTLDGDSKDEEIDMYQIHRGFENVQILPANADGTIFMVDTDSMQQMPESKIESYILKNGSVVPLHEENHENAAHEILINKSEIISNDFTNFIQSCNQMTSSDESSNRQMQIPENSVLCAQIEENHVNTDDVLQKQTKKKTRSSLRNAKRKYVYEKVRQHSKEIAVIKKLLHDNIVPKYINKNTVLKFLKKRIPPTLLDLVNVNLNKTHVVSVENVDFFRSINTYSPELCKLLREKYKWILPVFDIDSID